MKFQGYYFKMAQRSVTGSTGKCSSQCVDKPSTGHKKNHQQTNFFGDIQDCSVSDCYIGLRLSIAKTSSPNDDFVHFLHTTPNKDRRFEVFHCILRNFVLDGTSVSVVQISGNDQQAAFGGQLMTGILHIYDSLMMRYADKNCVQERLATVTCMKTLLATSQTAKTSALNGW